MHENVLLTEIDARGVATVTLNRPAVHNAFNDELISRLQDVFTELGADSRVRVIVLAGNGKSFCAGADLNWMKAMVGYSEAENVADSSRLADMFYGIHACPKPTVARVHGAALAGGIGLVSACDMAVAAEQAKFAITEVKLGLLPANIALYLVPSIGERAMRRYAMTGETFDAAEAHRIGLVHEVATAAELDSTVARIVAALLGAGPHAVAQCKKLIEHVAGPVGEQLRRDTATWLARVRVGEEAQSRMQAFLSRR
ncbi:MAG: enoyl-CoA hydratase/isomerase family protein [Betaproteobacteria bacterium]|nr:MAG: enoyl-CoA hydratase/isomerase family protein [Betaproteobacteria bacterium]